MNVVCQQFTFIVMLILVRSAKHIDCSSCYLRRTGSIVVSMQKISVFEQLLKLCTIFLTGYIDSGCFK